jgi:3-oxoacyl-[acyl-carrier-protein] synthase II
VAAATREPIRVVATGLGAITAQGPSLEAFWEGVSGGRVAIRPVEGLPMTGYMTTLGGEVKERVAPQHDYAHPADIREPTFDFALKAAEEALQNCGIAATEQIPPERWGVVIGTCNAGMVSAERWWLDRHEGREPDKSLLLLIEPQALAETLSAAFGFKGPVLSVNTACAASANAIGYAAELVRQGQADAMLTGGAEALSGILFSGFTSLESLSAKPAAPYSRDRDGLSLGEGSGMIVLMREDLARELGAPIRAELLGYSLSADGYHPTAPHPEGAGAGRAIGAALKRAGVGASEVGYVNSHGTGTPKNDPAETAATKVGLGQHAYDTKISSTKSMIGHLLGAAGAAENIITVRALEEQVLPPTANYTEPDPECDLDYVPNKAEPAQIDVAVSNNFAFGGANASIVWGRAGARADAPPAPADDRVVVTGLSALTSTGLDPAALWESFAADSVGAKAEDGVWVGRVDFDPAQYLGPKERKRVDRLGLFSIISSKLALEDAGLSPDEESAGRIGVIVGTGVGPMESMEEFSGPVLIDGAAAANPAVFPNTVYNASGGQVAMKIGAVGAASTVTAGHAAGASSICYAFDLARSDQADAAIAVAADAVSDTVVEAYRQLGTVARDEPGTSAARGFALAEGGFALVLERKTVADARKARVYGELLGYGITSDAKGIGRWDRAGDGIERAMRLALEMAEVDASDVVAIWANANGLRAADRPEERAIARLFGDDANVLTPKRRLGEPMGAGAALSAVLALKSWEQRDDLRGPVVVNSLSLGGTNFSLVFAPVTS